MEATTSGKQEIHRISKDVSTRICTAQVVVTISGAIRQLVDNAIDAGATCIDVRVKTNGYDSLEVVDDGSGIDSSNFASLCKPHSTSKLTDFSDFRELSTLGFRGEALNALCALGSVTIVTRCETSLLGSRLKFDHKGAIVEQTNVARPVGTTVTVENLFETLPVRRKELERTSKREYARVLATVQCFALSRPDVRFICSNTVNGKRNQAICTPGKAGIKDVVTNLFGGRSDKNKMVDIVRELPDDTVCALYGLNPEKRDDYQDIQLSGFVSSCEHGFGRSAADRQFVYVNQRPVDYPKVCRAVNDVYQQYNRSQYPTIVLFIEVPPHAIDVNVTPDKRTVLFDREKLLVALVRSSILATFRPLLGSFTSVEDKRRNDLFSTGAGSSESSSNPSNSLSSAPSLPLPTVFDLLKDINRKRGGGGGILGVSDPAKRFRDNDVIGQSREHQPYQPSQTASQVRSKTLEAFAFKLIPHSASLGERVTVGRDAEKADEHLNALEDEESLRRPGSGFDDTENTPVKSRRRSSTDGSSSTKKTSSRKKTPVSAEKRKENPNGTVNLFGTEKERARFTPPMLTNLSRGFEQCTRSDDDALDNMEESIRKEEGADGERMSAVMTSFSVKQEPLGSQLPPTASTSAAPLPPSMMMSQVDTQGNFLRPQQTIKFSASRLVDRMKTLQIARTAKKEAASSSQSNVEPSEENEEGAGGEAAGEFSSAISPDENEKAERELDRVLSKSDFGEMSLVGQFNNGFIVTRLRDHLFIVDQHASDEKYNFERFQKKARVEHQRLINPQALDFGAVQEGVLRDNLKIFRANGFDFEFRDNDDGSSRAFLTSVPVLHSWQFDKNDIDEILSVLTEFPGEMYRPLKLRRIFASRACRKSVMVGTTLTAKHMLTIVQNLGTLDQPWNCPHGRPTLRHLFDLKHLLK